MGSQLCLSKVPNRKENKRLFRHPLPKCSTHRRSWKKQHVVVFGSRPRSAECSPLSRSCFFFFFTCLSKEKYIYWQIFSQNVAHREISQLIQSVTGDFPHPFSNRMGCKSRGNECNRRSEGLNSLWRVDEETCYWLKKKSHYTDGEKLDPNRYEKKETS